MEALSNTVLENIYFASLQPLSMESCRSVNVIHQLFFLNQGEIDRNRSATVIFCADIRTTIALDKALKECRRNTGDFVVTGHLGTDLSILPWNYLYGHPVVFVPTPSTESLASVRA